MRFAKISVVFLLIFFYLAFSYIRFYHFIGDINLKSPYLNNSISFENASKDGTANYIALGDSLSAGVGSETIEQTFVYLYAQKLSQRYGKVNLLNLAQPGGTTVDVTKFQLPRALEENPDYVTLLIGVNDLHNKRLRPDFAKKYSFILSELLSKTNAKITIIEIPYIGSKKVVYPPFGFLLNLRTKQYNKTLHEVVEKFESTGRIKVVPLYDATYTYSQLNPKYYSLDFFHPSGEGYVYWGELINAY